ncbi:Uma2 family endonuclease (plasmid) [Bacillus thuringiensis]|uniref:Uma2 family endonuclease n=1 Tax=Bacillus thuringiensis TaxID=1428 RepID=UPI0022245A23|nr:Uma2 family endonuclease [Bacillus thuringiensis]UYX56087.1 Uma2 family endonuclease [Bacillus thuringiensis]
MGASTKHQLIVANLYRSIHSQCEEHSTVESIFSPFRVDLIDHAEGGYYSPEPDLIGITDFSNLKTASYHGAPDFIVEVLSETTKLTDLGPKLNEYQLNGVKEYWIIDQWSETVYVYKYNEKETKYDDPISYSNEESNTIDIRVLLPKTITVKVSDIFKFKVSC